jgi:hypothetical protein
MNTPNGNAIKIRKGPAVAVIDDRRKQWLYSDLDIEAAVKIERERCAKICESRAAVQDKVFGGGPYAIFQLELAAEEIRNP